jgi:hypothetical protein
MDYWIAIDFIVCQIMTSVSCGCLFALAVTISMLIATHHLGNLLAVIVREGYFHSFFELPGVPMD